jgi:hypothetical protein
MMTLRRCLLAAMLAGAVLLPTPSRAADPVPGTERLAAHRAAYALTLAQARSNSNIASARGAMLYEVGDACEGWTTRQRFSLILTDRDGQEVETTSDYSTYETKDGQRIRFSLTQASQGAVSQRISGEATLSAEGGTVTYTDPQARSMSLPNGTLLPTVHTLHALEAARAGRRVLVAPLLDGTSVEGAQDTNTVMSAWQGPQPNERFPALASLGSVRMRVAFFERDQNNQGGGASAPDYEVGLRYFENGVADELKMDFGEFVVSGEMRELAILPGAC